MIDILPDEVLLEIFDYYVAEAEKYRKYEEWEILVHVCQKWRYVVFCSPLHLNLRILCSAGTPVGEKLAVWPPLPLIIKQYYDSTSKYNDNINIITALGHSDRVCEIDLDIPSPLLERVFPAMEKTFVGLKYLRLGAIGMAPVVSDSFLGGSAPHLQQLWSSSIPFPFPVLRKLLLSAPNLVILFLSDIPHSAYFSPEAMVTCLSVLTRLEWLCIGFNSPRSRPPQEGRHPPPTRSILPALTELTFIGVSEYLEDLVARIDGPLLNKLFIKFFHQLIFDTPQFAQFVGRTPNLKAYDDAHVIFSDSHAIITLQRRDNPGFPGLHLEILCRPSEWQLSSVAQLCTSSLPQDLIPELEHLYILEDVTWRPHWQSDLVNNKWSKLFHPFTNVKNLYLSQEFVLRIVPTLQKLVGEGVTEVLPNLQNIFLESGHVPEAIRQFIAQRELSSPPIAISYWTRQDAWSRNYGCR